MDISLDQLSDSISNIIQQKEEILKLYKMLDWNDSVYESYESLMEDLESSCDNLSEINNEIEQIKNEISTLPDSDFVVDEVARNSE